jgi:hypothetical protein
MRGRELKNGGLARDIKARRHKTRAAVIYNFLVTCIVTEKCKA